MLRLGVKYPLAIDQNCRPQCVNRTNAHTKTLNALAVIARLLDSQMADSMSSFE